MSISDDNLPFAERAATEVDIQKARLSLHKTGYSQFRGLILVVEESVLKVSGVLPSYHLKQLVIQTICDIRCKQDMTNLVVQKNLS
jgi:hypothetical protein